MKVTGQMILYEWEALVTRNLHAKYEGSISNSSKVMMTNVKVVHPTNQQTDRQKQYVPAVATGDIKMNLINDSSSKITVSTVSNFITAYEESK